MVTQKYRLNICLRDIKERYSIQLDHDLEELIDVIASGIGTLTNPHKIQNTFRSVKQSSITQDTIKNYLDYIHHQQDGAIRHQGATIH